MSGHGCRDPYGGWSLVLDRLKQAFANLLSGLDRGVNQPIRFMSKIPDPGVRKVVREEIFK